MGWTGVVTDAGMALLAQWSGGGHTLTLTKANVGSGTVDAEDLHAATNISSYQANASIVNAKDVGSGMKFKLQVGPSSGSAYTAHQIGIWGKLDSGAETLISIHQDSDTGVSVPAASTSADFAFVLYVTLAISNSEDLTVTLDSAAYVSQSDLNDAVDALEAVATSSANGMMSATDKAKLDGIDTQANKYVHPSHTENAGVPTGNQTPAFGSTFNVDQVANDALGHVTGHTTRTIKIPDSVASGSSAGLMSSTDFLKINPQKIAANTDLNTLLTEGWYYCSQSNDAATLTHCPTNYAFKLEVLTARADGSGWYHAYQRMTTYSTSGFKRYDRTYYKANANEAGTWGDWVEWKVTDTTYSAATQSVAGLMSAADKTKLDGVAAQANKYVHPADKTASNGVPTGNQTPGFGSTFNIDQIANDNNGHVTGHTTRTVKIPDTEASTSAKGLMSTADKTKMNRISYIRIADGSTTAWKDAKGRTADSGLGVVRNQGNLVWAAQIYSTGIMFGEADGHGYIGIDYNAPNIAFAGGSTTGSTDAAPKWSMKLKGTGGAEYTFPSSSKTLASTDAATQSAAGLMSATDKTNLDGIMSSSVDLSSYRNTTNLMGLQGRMAKIGKVVVGAYYGTFDKAITDLTAVLFTLPSGYRPASAQSYPCFASLTGKGIYNVTINEDGEAMLSCPDSSEKPAKWDEVRGNFIIFTA